MKPAPFDRMASLSLTALIHVAAGLALLVLTPPGDRARGGAKAARDGILTVELIPLDREAAPAQAMADAPFAKAQREAPSALRNPTPASAVPMTPSISDGAQAMARPSTMPTAEQPGTAKSELQGAAEVNYRNILLAHIARYRRYPGDARAAGIEGTVNIRFVLMRDGSVSDAWVATSSGRTMLDQEALAAIRRAVPMPGIPRELPDSVDITLPVDFAIS